MITGSVVEVRDTQQGGVFEVRVQPRAKRTRILGIQDGRLKVALASPPIDGRANEELREFFAEVFSVRRNAVVVLTGEHSRYKLILISHLESAHISAVIEGALPAKGARVTERS